MQALQQSKQNNSTYVRLMTKSSQDSTLDARLPKFILSQKGNDGNYTIVGEYDTVVGYITSIKIREAEVTINGKMIKKEFIQITLYNEIDDASYTIESGFNSVIKGILSRLVSVNFETTKVSLIVRKNKDGFAAGTVKDFTKNENIPFSDEVHPKNIIEKIKKDPKADSLKDDEDMYKKYISNQSDKLYKEIIKQLSELPKFIRPESKAEVAPAKAGEPIPTEEEDDKTFIDSLGQDDDLPF